jgi:hypothetical protein
MPSHFRPSHGQEEPSGLIAISADGWLIRLYGPARRAALATWRAETDAWLQSLRAPSGSSEQGR